LNRKQRRAAHIKHRPAKLSPVEMAEKMRNARPTEHYRFELFRDAEGKVDGRVVPCQIDWSWLDNVDHEGYDPRAANGPTYWRIDDTLHRYYSVFPRPDTRQLVLLINDMQANRELSDEFMPDNPQIKDTAERRYHPWLSLSFQVSPAIAADITTKEDEEELLARMKLLLPRSYDFAVAHDLPLDKPIGLVVKDDSNGRDYLIHVLPDEQLVDIDYAPAGLHDEMRASPNFHQVH